MHQTITEEAWGLVHSLATQCASECGIGTMSPAAYDTAWVAMTEKNGQPLFPEAYEYLKATQADDGTWAAETSDADGIVNTLAALLALKRQERQLEAVRADNERRCRAAEASLHRLLNGWDLGATDRVGLEVLVPNLLRLLEAEGLTFEFPARRELMELNGAKLARLGPVLTSPIQTTLIHTLEAFVGTLDFDKVKQHRMPNGSMLASPSSTAAYLMNATSWDNEAEAYLRMVYSQQASIGKKGGFPSAFPSTLFEISWVLDTLLEAGFDRDDFLLEDIRKLTVLLETNLKSQAGIVGFAPATLPDADDSAKTISALGLLGWNHNVEPMLKAFETDASFITYQGERNASTSANCNILSCLLRTPEPAKYTRQIVKCASFLSKTWMHNDGPDKWHTSVHYPMMLIAQAFTLLLKRWGKNELDHDAIPTKLVYQDVPRTLLDILSQTMGLQQADGSWESKREVTAYAILTLAPLLSLPWVDFLKPEGIACMYRGKAYLEDGRSSWREAEVLWIEKTAYSSKNLAHAYCLAASKIVVPMSSTSHRITELFPVQMSKKMARMLGFFAHVAPFSEAPKWKLQLSLLQSAQYASALKEARYAIFPRMEKASDEKYQEYIPFTWIGCRDHLSSSIPGEALWEMMLISMFNFQVDAFMETTAWDQYKGRLPELKAFIRALCSGSIQQRKRGNDSELGGSVKKVLRTNGMANGSSHAVNGDTKGASNGVLKHEGRLMNGDAKPVVNGNHLAPAAQLNGDSINVPTSHNGATKIGASADDDTNESNGSTMTNGTRNRKDSGKGLQGLNGDLGGSVQRLIDDLTKGEVASPATNKEVEETLTKFVNHALQHPKVLNSPPSMRAWLAHEMQTFLLAHITHMEDCIEMAESSDVSNDSATWSKPRTTFFNWVKTTSADHTSCPYSFVFFLCLIGEKGKDMIATIQQRYALEDACHHLATMCRQYNDFGSVVRDQEERNLNSVNFPEFVTTEDRLMSSKELTERRKSDLLAVAEYERRCLARVIGELDESLDAKTMQKLALFIQVTDLYGQIYVARDIGIRHMEAANPRRKE